MDAIVEDLISIIASEIEAFEQLLKTLHAKQRAIVEGQIERLNKYVQTENKLAHKTKSIEAERLEKTKELAKNLSLDDLNPRLSKIIEGVEGKYAQRLEEQRDLLTSLVEKIQTLNKSNQFLLNHSLKFIEQSIKILLGGNDKASIYQKDGKLQAKVGKFKVLDHSI